MKNSIKYKRYIIFICAIFLFSLVIPQARGDDYIKNVEIKESDINFDCHQCPPVAYLYITLMNNGDKKVANLSFEISYYSEGGYLIHKAIVKNALNETIPPKESRKYKVLLRGDFFNVQYEQYPYSQNEKVGDFHIKIINAKLTSR